MDKYILDIEDLGELVIDAVHSDSDNDPKEVSSHPVEDTKDASDNAKDKNYTCSLSMSFSGMGIKNKFFEGLSATLINQVLENFPPPTDETYKERFRKLQQAKAQGKLITLIRPNEDPVENCIITNISRSRDKTTGRKISVTVDFEQIQIKSLGIAVVPQIQLGKGPLTKFGTDKPKKNTKVKRRHASLPDAGLLGTQDAGAAKNAALSSIMGAWG